ncbi:MAG: MATE family efflux transporter [Lachnospiraceae bacterium]|nr:MATE family efflux transporter [Lachnospiraceae bacterium]
MLSLEAKKKESISIMEKRKEEKDNFLKDSVLKIALPVTLQSIFQASFSVVDQVMTGQLGSVSVAGIGLGSKFASLFNVLISAVATAAGIMIAQYVGSKNRKRVKESLLFNMGIAFAIAVIFMLLSLLFPRLIMSAYSKDEATILAAAQYLWIIAFGFIPMVISLFLSTLLRSTGLAKLPMYGSVASIVINLVLDYAMIFGKAGFPAMGIAGAAWATTIARMIEALWLVGCLLWALRADAWNWGIDKEDAEEKKQGEFSFWQILLPILLPVLLCEFLWSLGENIYAVIYGRMGTMECAAMTLINPIQALVIGALSGLSAAAGIIVGKLLGEEKYEEAYARSKSLMKYGLIGSAFFSILLLLIYPYYVQIFRVEEEVKMLTGYILIAYALISPVKVQNMILGGGILRSGGQTKYVLMVDTIGTWCFGIPLGFLAAFVLHLPIYLVYFILSLEECVRFGISWVIFRRRKWMKTIAQTSE